MSINGVNSEIYSDFSTNISRVEEIWKDLFIKKIIYNSNIENIYVCSSWEEYINSDNFKKGISGVFLDKDEFEKRIAEIKIKELKVVPSYLEIIGIVKEQVIELFEFFTIENLNKSYIEENMPNIEGSDFLIECGNGKEKNNFDLINSIDISKDLKNIIISVSKTLIKIVLNGTPVFSNISNNEVFVYKDLENNDNLFNENVVINTNDSVKVISIEGPQGLGKTTQIKEIKKYFYENGILISSNIPKEQDPSKIVINWENSNNKIMKFLERQRITRKSYEARYNYVKDSNYISILDRSIFSIILFHCTISRINSISIKDRKKDIEEIKEWYEELKKNYNPKIIILTNKNIVKQFFRMKKDINFSNKNSDFSSQILENIFYKLLLKLNIGTEIKVDNESIDSVTKKIIQLPYFKET